MSPVWGIKNRIPRRESGIVITVSGVMEIFKPSYNWKGYFHGIVDGANMPHSRISWGLLLLELDWSSFATLGDS